MLLDLVDSIGIDYLGVRYKFQSIIEPVCRVRYSDFPKGRKMVLGELINYIEHLAERGSHKGEEQYDKLADQRDDRSVSSGRRDDSSLRNGTNETPLDVHVQNVPHMSDGNQCLSE